MMKSKRLWQISVVAISILALSSVAMAAGSDKPGSATTLVDTVRQGTARFKSFAEAKAAGYGLFHGCVSGPQGGAMGVHYVNGDLVGDGEVDALHPEALLYETSYGELQLTGVEFVVLAADWDAKHDTPPVLEGQLFNYNGSPNRYGIPAFYELHVWAWKDNPSGAYADWNPQVTCDDFSGEMVMQPAAQK